jgi:glucokinase
MAPEHSFIGLDVGGTKVAAALVRPAPPEAEAEAPAILARITRPTQVTSAEVCLQGIEACIAELTRGVDDVAGIGVGVASMVDFAAGRVVESVNLPLTDVPLRDHLSTRFGLPVAIDNDATTAAIGEHLYGAGVGTRDMVMLTLGTGVGGGIISGGRPLRGSSGAAAEIGHMVVEVDGVKCPANCPGYGCLEAYAAGPAMSRAARRAAELAPASALGRAQAAGEEVDGRLLTRLAGEGDAAAAAVLERVGTYLGAGLVTLSNLLDPELFVIGGGAAAAGELLLGPARRFFAARALPPARDRVRIVPAAFGADAGVIGAAALALSELS